MNTPWYYSIKHPLNTYIFIISSI